MQFVQQKTSLFFAFFLQLFCILFAKLQLVFWFNSIILFVIVVMTIFYILNEATWFQNWLHELGFKMNSKNK